MSTPRPTSTPPAATVPPSDTGSPEHSSPTRTTAVPTDAGTRGSTTIADRVVERMAAAVAGEVEQVGGSERRVLGVTAGRQGFDRAPEVRARVHGNAATVAIRLSVAYPASVAAVTETVRARVIERLAELADVRVRTVEITVTALYRPHTRGRVIT